MTDREKLIELIDGALEHASKQCEKLDSCCACPHGEHGGCQSAFILDYLLSNGVTFAKDTDVPSKWIHVEERKPIEEWKKITSESEAEIFPCLCCRWDNHFCSKRYVTKLYFDGEYFIDLHGVILDEFITHWMPMPEPPKED